MRTLQRLLLCVICLALRLAAQPWRVDPTRLNAWAQDSTGQVWAIGAFMSADLYRWEGSNWNPVPVNGVAENSRPFALASGPDGAVYCLWSAGKDAHALTWHQGSVSKTLAQFAGDVAYAPTLFVDPVRNVWITGRGIHIYRVTPEGKAESVYTVEYDHHYDDNLPKGARLNFDPVYPTADGQGRIWFWSGGLGGGDGVPSLEGILIYDGKNFDYHRELPGVPFKRFSAVECEDAEHIFLAAAADHLYRVDTQTLAVAVIPEPAPGAFRFVQRIFHAEGATYVVAANGSMPVAERKGEGRIAVLWRQDSGWKRVINGIDMRPETITDPLRPFLATPAGLWLGAYGAGPWFIPNGPGEPTHIDWRYGYSLDDSDGLMELPDGRLLIVAATSGSMDCGSTAVIPADLLAAFQSPSEVRTLNPLRVLVPDRHGHIWGFLSGDPPLISEWDGKTWTDHTVPEDFDPLNFGNFGADSQDRIWLLYTRCRGPVAILDPRRGKVESYPDFSAALQAQLAHRASFHVQGSLFTVSTFTTDGRIGYRDPCGQAHYFNGQAWQMWKPQDIDPTARGIFDGPSFFDRAGNFAVDIAGRTWEYVQTIGWRTTSFEPGFGTDQERLAPHALAPPPGCEISNPESVAQDRLGTYWLTSHGQLYRAIPGLCLPQFSSEQRQPFGDSRTVKAALIDPQGNAFLETYFRAHPDVGEYVIVDSRPPVPQTKMHARVEESGIVRLHFETQVRGKAWFTWRVDGGAWTPPTESAETTVNWLANGKHRIEGAALDERLQIDLTPAVAEVVIQFGSQKQVAALIEQLKNPDYSQRDAAVAALIRQPALALPLLQSAREKAGPDQRWWIDAAIQQIKENAAKSGSP